MAAKRMRDDTEPESDKLAGKKQLKSIHDPANFPKGLYGNEDVKLITFVMEQVVRKVVHEELERGLCRNHRNLPKQVQASEIKVNDPPASAILAFEKPLFLPVFTGSKIEDVEGNPLRIILINTESGERLPLCPSSPMKVEIVAVDGDFPGTRENWTSEEFDKNIVKERAGKRPLITGDVNISLKGGSSTVGEISFTDNSSWIRSRHFRIGAKVAGGSYGGMRIVEALTEPFIVKDHRGESYKKHYPPAPDDEVWRLEKIGKDGVYHTRLRTARITTVQEFLILSVHNPARLRLILGPNMPEKTWEMMLAHARTCETPMTSLNIPTRAPTRQISSRVTLPRHGAMMPQFGYWSSASMPHVTIFPNDHEALIDAANQSAGFHVETINGSLELQFAADWGADPPSDHDSDILFNGC